MLAPLGSYEERVCWRCDRGQVYAEVTGWTPCPGCSGTGRALAFVYPKRARSAVR